MNVGNQSPLEARAQPFFERRNFVRRTIAAQHDLLLRVVKRIEGMEKFSLGALFPSEKLNIVDQQDVNRAIPFAEIQHAIVANRVDHFVHESFGRDVGESQASIVLHHVLPHRVHQMRLAQTDTAIDKERVVRS